VRLEGTERVVTVEYVWQGIEQLLDGNPERVVTVEYLWLDDIGPDYEVTIAYRGAQAGDGVCGHGDSVEAATQAALTNLADGRRKREHHA
jgi:hypothetical protein